MSEAEKRKSHKRILDAAARLMRESGVESTSVSDVMSAAGLTHGGFYRHFSSKEELAAAAFQHAVEGIVADWEAAATPDGRRRAREEYVATYLSEDHVAKFGEGCPLAAFGAEAGREDGPLRTAASDAVRRMAALLDDPCPVDGGGQTKRGVAFMALLLGSLTMARLLEKPEEARMALEAGRMGLRAIRQCWPATNTEGAETPK